MIIVHHFPYYWGVEKDAPDRSLITRSTLHEVLPPFRQSVWAFRIRVSHRHWLHLGIFKYDPIAGRWGMNAPVEEISTWRGPNVGQEEEAEADSWRPDEVRPAERDSADRLLGGKHAQDGGTVQGVQPQRVGPGLAGSADGVTSANGSAGD